MRGEEGFAMDGLQIRLDLATDIGRAALSAAGELDGEQGGLGTDRGRSSTTFEVASLVRQESVCLRSLSMGS